MTTPAADPRRPPLLEIMLAVGSLLGLVLTVIGLDIDRTFRTVGAVLLVLAAAGGIAAIVAARWRRAAVVASTCFVVAAVGVLAFAPPSGSSPGTPTVPPNPSAPPALIVSSVEVVAAGPSQAATVDLSLRNPGATRVGLTRAQVTILDHALIPVCVSAANTEVSADYDLTLPENPAPGAQLTKVLHQEIGPDELDRFTLRFGTPTPVRPLDSYVYRVRITISTDNGQPPVTVGEFLLEGPNGIVGTDHYFPSQTPATLADARDHGLCGDDVACQRQTQACWNRNRDSLERLLGDGTKLSDGAEQAKRTLFG